MANQPQGKIFLYNYDAIQALDDEKICIGLSPKTIALCLASIEYARWEKRWQSLVGTPIVKDTIEAWADAAYNELMNESEACMCCEEEIALLRQLLSGQSADYSRQLQSADDGTPQSFAPNAPAAWDGGINDEGFTDANYDAALCKAVNDFMAEAINRAGQELGLGSAILGLIGTVVGAFFPPAGFAVAVVVGLTNAALQAAMADTAAYNRVVCCILKGLRGHDVNATTFKNALASSGCELSDPSEAVFASIFTTHAANVNNYRSFTAHYANSLSTEADTSTCECCETGQDDLRLDYNWHYLEGYNNWVLSPKMARDGNILHISCYHQNNDETPNDNEFGFKLYSPSGCCQRMRILNTSPTLTYGSGNYYPPIGQREGVRIECCGDSTNFDANNWFSTTELRLRFAEDGYTNPAWLYDIQIEIDPDFEGC